MATQITAIWAYSFSDETGFLLQRCDNLSGLWYDKAATNASTLQYTDTDVVVGDTCSYQVAATNPYGTGSFSNTASVYVYSSGPITIYLSFTANYDSKLFDGSISSSLTASVDPDISIYGDTASYSQSFDEKYVGQRTLMPTVGTIISPSGNTYIVSALNPNDGEIIGPPTGSLLGGYTNIPVNTNLPYLNWYVDVEGMASGSNGFLLFSTDDDGNYFAFTSSDCMNWQTASNGGNRTGMDSYAIGYADGLGTGAGRYIGLNQGGSNQGQYSDDGGITWIAMSLPSATTMRDVLYDGVQFVAVGDGGTIFTSLDGITWATLYTGTGDDLSRIIYNGGRYVSVGPPQHGFNGGTGTIYITPDLLTWTAVSSSVPSTNAYYDVAYSPSLGIYLAIGENGLMATSPDGVNWTDRSAPPPIYSGNNNCNLSAVAWNDKDSYFAVSDRYGYIYNSSDGINWTLNTINPNFQYPPHSGNFYTYVVLMRYYRSIDKFVVVGNTSPT